MKTVKVVVPGKPPRFLPDIVIHKGKIAQLFKRGVGEPEIKGGLFDGEGDTWEEYKSYVDYYKPFFNAKKVEAAGLTKEDIDKAQKAGEIWKHEKYLDLMLEMGENEFGYKVLDAVEERRKKQKEKIKEETGFIFELSKITKSYDEDGPTNCYHYTLTHEKTGQVFKFTERNVFDVGRVINPDFEIDPGWGKGGILTPRKENRYLTEEEVKACVFEKMGNGGGYTLKINGETVMPSKDENGRLYYIADTEVLVWQSCAKKDEKFIGWQEVREATDLEIKAFNIVEQYGRAFRGIRM